MASPSRSARLRAPLSLARGQRKPRVVFVLSGGGNLGAIQVGQLRALTEHGIEPDLVLGCSVGALNGAAFAADPTPDGVAALAASWADTTTPELMPSSRVPGALALVRKGSSLYSNEGLRRSIHGFLNGADTFEELRVPFQCVATDVDLARVHWFDAGPIVEPILASAALPAVYPPVTIDGRRYLDGGVIDNVPLSRAFRLGAKRVFVLHVGLHGKPDAEFRRPYDAARIAYWIARNARFREDLAAIPKGIEVVVLPPGDRPDLRYDDFSQSDALIAQGYEGAIRHLDELAAAEAQEPGLAERLRLEKFASADWRKVLELRRSGSADAERAPNGPTLGESERGG